MRDLFIMIQFLNLPNLKKCCPRGIKPPFKIKKVQALDLSLQIKPVVAEMTSLYSPQFRLPSARARTYSTRTIPAEHLYGEISPH